MLSKLKEIKAAIGVFDEVSYTWEGEASRLVKAIFEKIFKTEQDRVVDIIQGGVPPREWVYNTIANVAGDFVESGQYHIYRGVLNPMGPGGDLLKLYDSAVEELVKIGALDAEKAEKEKRAIRENIKTVG